MLYFTVTRNQTFAAIQASRIEFKNVTRNSGSHLNTILGFQICGAIPVVRFKFWGWLPGQPVQESE